MSTAILIVLLALIALFAFFSWLSVHYESFFAGLVAVWSGILVLAVLIGVMN